MAEVGDISKELWRHYAFNCLGGIHGRHALNNLPDCNYELIDISTGKVVRSTLDEDYNEIEAIK